MNTIISPSKKELDRYFKNDENKDKYQQSKETETKFQSFGKLIALLSIMVSLFVVVVIYPNNHNFDEQMIMS